MLLIKELLLIFLVLFLCSFRAGNSLISLNTEILEFLMTRNNNETKPVLQRNQSYLPDFIHVLWKWDGMSRWILEVLIVEVVMVLGKVMCMMSGSCLNTGVHS